MRLERRPLERIWGREALPAGFDDCALDGAPVGEIWFENCAQDALLVKYLFTSDRLSIQVHPDDKAARAAGYPSGKDEAWLVLDAEPGAVIGLGLKRRVSREKLRIAALDGSIEALIDWRPVKAGDSFYSPAGTIHAIGGGLSLIEIQQNSDVTYRLYDYGRPRELHLDEAVAAAQPGPLPNGSTTIRQAPGRRLLTPGGTFTVERWTLAGRCDLGGQELAAGTVWRVQGHAHLDAGDGVDLLAAYPGPPRHEAVRAES
jgi:mannose-6-phosphate isomerase